MQTLMLFGQPQLEEAGKQIDITNKKGLALIAYLAVQPGHTASRETVGTLLWPDFDDGRARANLRNLLYSLNKTAFENWIEADTEQLKLITHQHTIDILQFHDCLTNDELETAVSYYKGTFLEGFHLADNDLFSDWLHEQQEQFRRNTLTTLQTITDDALKTKDWQKAERYARHQIQLDDLQEQAWQQLLLALAGNGRRAKAIQSFEELKKRYQSELQIDPSPQTLDIINQIRQGSQPLSTITKSRTKAQQILLQKVNQFWIEGVLEQSLHGAALIELGLQTRPEALAYPWEMVLQRPSQPDQQIPAGTSLYQIFQEHGRALLILGEPGSGKTTMMLDLARQAIKQAQDNATRPIPVVFNLSSWAQEERPLKTWLIEELNAKYLIPANISQEWLNQDLLLLLLDGLDEVRPNKQEGCIRAINQFRQAHGLAQMVVCSRTAAYELKETKLRLDTAVQLQPLTPKQIDAYLQAGGDSLKEVRRVWQQDRTLQEMAASPLMLSIMTLAYRNLTQTELSAVQPTAAREQHLFDTYVTQMARRKGETYPYPLSKTRRWLSFLASKLTQQKQTIFLLEMLQPGWLDGRGSLWLYTIITRSVGGLLIALLISIEDYILFYDLIITLLLILFTGYKFIKQQQNPHEHSYRLAVGKTLFPILAALAILFFILSQLTAFGLTEAMSLTILAIMLWLPFGLLMEYRDSKRTVWNDIQTVEILTWSWQRARRTTWRGMAVGITGSAFLGILLAVATSAEIGINSWNTIWPLILFFGAPMGLSVGLLTGFSRDVIPLKTAPDQGLWLTLRLILGGSFIGAIGIGLIVTVLLIIGAPFPESPGGYLEWVLFGANLGLRFGLLVGLWYGGLDLIYHFVLRSILALQHKMPWRIIAFLDTAAQHLYLRKVGGGYLFTHKLLLDYFAEQETITAVSDPYHER